MRLRQGFTLIELLVVIAIIGILASLLLPVLSRAKQRAQGVLCLNNGRQMIIAVNLYSGDNHEFYPPNPDDGNTVPGHNWCPGQAGIGGPEEFNSDVLKDPERSLLVRYLSGGVSVFKCPADRRISATGVPAARTFSMSQAVGTICAAYDASRGSHEGPPNISVNGPWLNNNFDHRRNSPWRTFGKTSDFGAPGPSGLWVFVDEDARGLNDAAFAFSMESPQWWDAPGTYHNGGCGFAFADGHSETHKWISAAPKGSKGATVSSPNDQRDWLWMRERTSADTTGQMPLPH